jgi:hypothetical protein
MRAAQTLMGSELAVSVRRTRGAFQRTCQGSTRKAIIAPTGIDLGPLLPEIRPRATEAGHRRMHSQFKSVMPPR